MTSSEDVESQWTLDRVASWSHDQIYGRDGLLEYVRDDINYHKEWIAAHLDKELAVFGKAQAEHVSHAGWLWTTPDGLKERILQSISRSAETWADSVKDRVKLAEEAILKRIKEVPEQNHNDKLTLALLKVEIYREVMPLRIELTTDGAREHLRLRSEVSAIVRQAVVMRV